MRSTRCRLRAAFAMLIVAALICSLVTHSVGCSTTAPTSDYVKADRSTYETIAPLTRGLVNGDIKPSDIPPAERDTIYTKLRTWERRIVGAEESMPAAPATATANLPAG